jgi:hypothetical protein
VLCKGLTVQLINAQAIIVACAVPHNICIDMHDNIPNDWPSEDNANDNMGENNPLNCKRTTNRGRQARSGLIEDHFANLQIILRRNNYMVSK